MSTLVENNKDLTVSYVPTSAAAVSVTFGEEMIHVALADGRTISVPVVWFPRLRDASAAERENFEIGPAGIGIHWPDLDEDLSVAGLLGGIEQRAS